MTRINQKEVEMRVFSDFLRHMDLENKWRFECRPPPEPDILCTNGANCIAFELVSLTDSNIAKSVSDARRNPEILGAFYTGDPTREIIQKISDKCNSY